MGRRSNLGEDRRRLVAAVLAAGVVGTAAASLPGAAIGRTLPDGRAYEMVSPVDKNGGDVASALTASPDGDRLAFYSPTGFAGAPSNSAISSYVAERGVHGWTTHPMTPKVMTPNIGSSGGYRFTDFPEDLRESIAVTRSGVEANVQNAFLTQLDGSTTWLTGPPVGNAPVDDKLYAGRSLDGSHIVFETAQPFTDEAAPGDGHQIWEWVDGRFRLVSYLPDGSLNPAGASVGTGANGSVTKGTGFSGTLPQPDAVSEDGSKIFFGLGENFATRVYVRVNGTQTRELSLSQRTGSVGQSSVDARFAGASADGDVAVFTTAEQLTDDGTPNGGIYAFDLRTNALRFLSSGATDPNGAQVEGVSAVSRDGARVYFVAQSVLVPGKGVAGGHNMYVSGPDGVAFVATLDGSDAQNWTPSFNGADRLTTRTSQDGRYFLFQSWVQITGVDNAGHQEIYLYDADHGTTTCVSCGSPGHAAGGDASIIANPLPRGGNLSTSQPGRPRVFSDDADRLFFQTTDPLVPEDGNDRSDVYEYWTATGAVSLISSGTGGYDSEIVDNSPDGNDVFFFTRDALVRRDTDGGAKDVYDARVGGGFADVPDTTPCSDDACQPAPSPAPSPAAPLTGALTNGGSKEVRAPRLFVRRITATGRRNVVKTGRLTLVANVEAGGTIRATGTARYGKHTVYKLKSSSVRLGSAGTRHLHVSLPRAVRSLLKRHRKVKLAITVSYNKATSPVLVALTLS
jgi:hypothetical protein